MNPEHVKRLKDEQDQAIRVSNDQIQNWNKLKNDYVVLSDRLVTLPDKITHEVMVPLGPKAFMPGQLVHTNEILVLLGDNWFVERSAKQASTIVQRRIKSIDKQIKDLELQRNLLVNRSGYTSELKELSEGKGDVVDINEEYDEEKERKWKIKHEKSVQKYRKQLKEEEEERSRKSIKVLSDQDLLDHLDKLEKQEEKGNELDTNNTEEGAASNPTQTPTEKAVDSTYSQDCSKESTPYRTKKTVRWEDDQTADSDDWTSTSSEDETVAAHKNQGNSLVINFSHSSESSQPKEVGGLNLSSEMVTTDGDGGGSSCNTINSPSDIYKLFVDINQTQPKSILKSPTTTDRKFTQKVPPDIPVQYEDYKEKPGRFDKETPPDIPVQYEDYEKKPTPGSETAFSSEVIEKIPMMSVSDQGTTASGDTPVMSGGNPGDTQQQPLKKISKFKASRLQR